MKKNNMHAYISRLLLCLALIAACIAPVKKNIVYAADNVHVDVNEYYQSTLSQYGTPNYWGNDTYVFANATGTVIIKYDIYLNNVFYETTNDSNIDTPGDTQVKITNIKTLDSRIRFTGTDQTFLASQGALWAIPFEYTVYPITYDLQGGIIKDAPINYDYVTPRDIPNPTRAGYVFAGWTGWNGNTPQKDVKIPVHYPTTNGADGTVNLKANWVPASYNVTIPTNISYTNMPVGNVKQTTNYDVNVNGQIGANDSVVVTAEQNNTLANEKDGIDLTSKTTQGKQVWNAEEVNKDGGTSAKDLNTITGDVKTSDKWTWTVNYTAFSQHQDFIYTGSVQTFTAPIDGNYKLETWGAEGGGDSTYYGGKGGYSYGNIKLVKGQKLYIAIGEAGKFIKGGSTQGTAAKTPATFNGGARGQTYEDASNVGTMSGSGGGATSIQLSLYGDGQLYNYESVKDTDVLIVAGGGGAGNNCNHPWNYAAGGYGGGENGGNSVDLGAQDWKMNGGLGAIGGSQTSGSAFGRAVSNENYAIVGAGGGWYGGVSSVINGSGGGSGHIGTMLTDSHTIAGNQTFNSPSGTDETGHSGNGYARITYIGS